MEKINLYSKKYHCGIYKITNNLNGKSYIGQSTQIEKRINYHKRQGKSKNKPQLPLYIDMHKYGIDNFNYEILELCNIDELDNKQKYWISFYNTRIPNGYNNYTQNNFKPIKAKCIVNDLETLSKN